MTMTSSGRPRGRPRDPEIEPRVFAAALAVYAERGWHGFSIEAVSRQAGVGQASLYRRWASKAELLARAVASAEQPLPLIDTGSSREDLLALARHLVVQYRGPSGVIGLRMVLDARTHPELAEQFMRMTTDPRAREVQRIVRRAIARGDLAPSASLNVVLQVLIGATLSHVLLGGVDQPPRTGAADERFLTRLVDSLLVPREAAEETA